MFKVIIAGTRTYEVDNKELFKIDNLLSNYSEDDIELVTGCARGADQVPYYYEQWHGYKVTEFPADWDKYGKSAGYIRNEQMAKYADALIALWDGKSKGTKHMIDLAKKHGLKIRIIRI